MNSPALTRDRNASRWTRTRANQTITDFSRTTLFAKNFFAHPRMLGSIVPSSRFLVRRLLRDVEWHRARTVVEFGPGIGNITTAILQRLRPDGRLIAFDTNEQFIEALRATIDDPRLLAVNTSAEHLRAVANEHRADSVECVVSGIPFSIIPPAIGRMILEEVRSLLSPGGVLLVYQFSAAVKPVLNDVFSDVEHEFEWLNVLPAHVFRCRNNG